jgi:hypothetical protein
VRKKTSWRHGSQLNQVECWSNQWEKGGDLVGKESEEVSQWLQGPGHSEAKREKKYLTHDETEEESHF